MTTRWCKSIGGGHKTMSNPHFVLEELAHADAMQAKVATPPTGVSPHSPEPHWAEAVRTSLLKQLKSIETREEVKIPEELT
jgi:hypothetical protein